MWRRCAGCCCLWPPWLVTQQSVRPSTSVIELPFVAPCCRLQNHGPRCSCGSCVLEKSGVLSRVCSKFSKAHGYAYFKDLRRFNLLMINQDRVCLACIPAAWNAAAKQPSCKTVGYSCELRIMIFASCRLSRFLSGYSCVLVRVNSTSRTQMASAEIIVNRSMQKWFKAIRPRGHMVQHLHLASEDRWGLLIRDMRHPLSNSAPSVLYCCYIVLS